MNKRKEILLAVFVVICVLPTMSQNDAHGITTIVEYKNWKIFDGASSREGALRETTIINEMQYVTSNGSNYYRQSGDKIYQYCTSDSCEQLLFDYGVNVGNVFPLYHNLNLIVENVVDTLITTKTLQGNVEKAHRCIYLRGIEDPSFTDVWIEGLGSIHYGIFRPDTKDKISSSRLLVSAVAKEVIMFPFHEGKHCGTDANLNVKIIGDTTQLNFKLVNDSLHVYGYYHTNCVGELYCMAEQETDIVKLSFSEFRSAANCVDYHAIDFKLPGFSQNCYTIFIENQIVSTVRKENTSIHLKQPSEIPTPYYNLQGRKVANPTRGIYIKDGKKIAVD